MTQELRKKAAMALFQHLYQPGYDAIAYFDAHPLPEAYKHLEALLRVFFSIKKLRLLTQNNVDFALSVARETTKWCQETFEAFQNGHSSKDEEKSLIKLKEKMEQESSKRWIELTEQLVSIYPEMQRDWRFFQQRLQSLEANREGNQVEQDTLVIRNKIITEWEQKLIVKKRNEETEFFKSAFQVYYTDLLEKINQLSELGNRLAPFFKFVQKSWTATLGKWNQMDWRKMADYARILQRDRRVREITDLLGRFHLNAQQIELITMQTPMPEEAWQPNPYGRSEITGVTYSDQISAVLPSEVSLLSSEETEIIFTQKFVEKKLLTWQYRSNNQKIDNPEPEVTVSLSPESIKGPFIICIDTSGSMFGEPERVAKAITFAILQIAMETDRKAFLISFSSDIQVTELTNIEGQMDKLMDFLRMSFHGGTDMEPALEKAVEMLQTPGYAQADVLTISDFSIPGLSQDLLNQVLTIRAEHGTRFHSLHISRNPKPFSVPLQIFDHQWLYDLNNPHVIRQTLQDLGGLR